MQNPDLTSKQKAKARKDLLKERRKDISDRLLRLHEWAKTNSNPEDLKGEDRRIYDLFASYNEPDKFKAAAKKGRLRFQLGQRDKFIEGIFYSGRYIKEMEQIFHEAGLPIELTRLPFVESSFNIKARSRVGASGIWQFMRYTGRKFLRISGSSDERNDPIKATRAAARMLRINYEMLQDWALAVTGYNHGPAGVARMVKKYKTSDIADLVDERHGRFGFASANFYASFLAAVLVEREAEKHFGVVYWDDPVPAAEIRPTRTVNKKMLLSWFGGDMNRAKDLNPHLTRAFWSGYGALGSRDFIRVPNEIAAFVQEELKNAPKREKALAAQTDEALEGIEYYVIGPGETLSEIAAQFGLSLSRLIDLNDIQNPRRIRAGQKIKVPKK